MFDLALKLGMTVAELGRRMSAAEMAEWAAYFRVIDPPAPSPSPPSPDDEAHAGLDAAAVAGLERLTRRR